MTTLVGSLLVSLGLDSAKFKSGLSAADKEMRKAKANFERVGQKMRDIGGALSVGVTLPFLAMGKAAVQGALDQAAAMGQVEAALKSMGNVSGKTAGELEKFADSLEMRSLFDADVILKQVTANLLTFGNVAGQEFDRAQQAAVDMATRMGTEPQSAAIMLGKALNDPIAGISALTRVGVQFTESQKAQIKAMMASGQTAKAQGIILAEVEKQFKGAGEAAANTDPWRKMSVAVGQAGDEIGKIMLPYVKSLAETIESLSKSFTGLDPTLQTVIVSLGAIAAVVGPTLVGFGLIVTAVAPLAPMFVGFGAALLGLSPIIAGVGAAVGAFYLIWKNWDSIAASFVSAGQSMKAEAARIANGVFGGLKAAAAAVQNAVATAFNAMTGYAANLYNGLKTWLMDRLGAVWNWLNGKIEAAKKSFFGLYDAVVGHSYIPDMVDEIGQHMARLDANLVQPAKNATDAAKQSFEDLRARVSAILDEVFPEVRALTDYNAKRNDLKAWLDEGRISAEQYFEAMTRLQRKFAETQANTPSGELVDMKAVANDNKTMLEAEMKSVSALVEKHLKIPAQKSTAAVVESFANMAEGVLGSLQGLSNALKNGNFLEKLTAVVDVIKTIAETIKAIKGVTGSSSSNGDASSSLIAGFRANGGPVMAGKSYVVGERGPELFTPGRSGGIVSNDNLRAGGRNVFDLRGAVVTADLLGQINQMVSAGEARAVQGGAQLAMRQSGRVQSRTL